MKVKRGLRNSILLPTLTYGSETLIWNRIQQTRVYGVEMSCLRGTEGQKDESNESVYERCDMGPCVNGVKCDVVEWVNRNTWKWFDHIEMKNSEELVKKVCE